MSVFLTNRQKILGAMPRGRLGYSFGCGRALCGYTKCGYENEFAGQYQRLIYWGRKKYVKMPFYFPRNPKTEGQLVCQNKFADAVVSWQELNDEQKLLWTKNAKRKRLPGYHFYLSEYLKNN